MNLEIHSQKREDLSIVFRKIFLKFEVQKRDQSKSLRKIMSFCEDLFYFKRYSSFDSEVEF